MPNSKSETHNERGIELAERGWEQEAFLEFEKAIGADPDFAPAYDNIANLHAERGDYLKALGLYLRALEVDPEDPVIHYNFGCFLTNYATEMAASEYQLAAQAESDFPEAHLNLGVLFLEQGRVPEAIEELELAKKLNPNDGETSYELACAELQMGHFKEAVAELRRATQKDPAHTKAWLLLGSCYLQQRFYTEANTALLKSLELEPRDPDCLCELAALRLAQQEPKQASSLLKKALKLNPFGTRNKIQTHRHLSHLSEILEL